MKYVVTEPWKAAGIDVRLCEVGDAIHEVFEGAEIEIFQDKSRKTVPSKTFYSKRSKLQWLIQNVIKKRMVHLVELDELIKILDFRPLSR